MNAGAKHPHPAARGLAPTQEAHLQVPEKPSQKELEAMALGTAADVMEIVSGVRGARDRWGFGLGQPGPLPKGPSFWALLTWPRMWPHPSPGPRKAA